MKREVIRSWKMLQNEISNENEVLDTRKLFPKKLWKTNEILSLIEEKKKNKEK